MTKKPEQELQDLGKNIVQQIKAMKNPEIIIPIRALSNVEFNKKTKTLQLGNKEGKRTFFNVGHAKKFLQTVEVASISKNLLEVGKHASLRDVFYMAKRTIPGTHVNMVDDQSESDDIIEDLEVIMDLSREQLNINANKNGSVAGKVIIEDKIKTGVILFIFK